MDRIVSRVERTRKRYNALGQESDIEFSSSYAEAITVDSIASTWVPGFGDELVEKLRIGLECRGWQWIERKEIWYGLSLPVVMVVDVEIGEDLLCNRWTRTSLGHEVAEIPSKDTGSGKSQQAVASNGKLNDDRVRYRDRRD